MDDSSDRVQIQKSVNEKLIDYYIVDYNGNQQIIPTNGLSNDLNWIYYIGLMGSSSNQNFRTLY